MADGSSEQHRHDDSNGDWDTQKQMYLRFGAMILTGMVVMYWVMFVGSWEPSRSARRSGERSSRWTG